jgi:predicted PurR-regulated permease PerM
MLGWRIALWLALVLGIGWFLYAVRGVLLPFVISFVLAALLEPTVRRLRLRGFSRGKAVAVVVGGFLIVGTALILLVTPRITSQIAQLTERIDQLTKTLAQADDRNNYFYRWNPVQQMQRDPTTAQIDRMFAQYGSTLERVGLPATREAFMEQYVERQRPKIVQAVQAGFNSFFGVLTGLFSQILLIVAVPILVPFILLEMEEFKRKGPKWIPPSIRSSTISVINDVAQVFVRYLRGISWIVLMYATATTLLFLLLGVPYAILLGILFGTLYLVPYIGNMVSMVILFTLVGFNNVTGPFGFSVGSPWGYALICVAAFFVVGSCFDQIIVPKVVGGTVGLSPVVSIFVIMSFGALFGLPGMVVAFPFAGSVKIVLDRLLRITGSTTEALALPSVPLRHRSA